MHNSNKTQLHLYWMCSKDHGVFNEYSTNFWFLFTVQNKVTVAHSHKYCTPINTTSSAQEVINNNNQHGANDSGTQSSESHQSVMWLFFLVVCSVQKKRMSDWKFHRHTCKGKDMHTKTHIYKCTRCTRCGHAGCFISTILPSFLISKVMLWWKLDLKWTFSRILV